MQSNSITLQISKRAEKRQRLSLLTVLTCTRCKVEQSIDEFEVDTRNSSGRCSHCRSCRRASHLAQYYRKKEEYAVVSRARYYRDLEASRTKQRQWYHAHREQRAASTSRRKKQHPERFRVHCHNYRARRRNADGSFTTQDMMRLLEIQQGQCAYCGTSLECGFDMDHIIPLSRGGTNYPDNIALACETCNSSKGDLTPDEWIEARATGKTGRFWRTQQAMRTELRAA